MQYQDLTPDQQRALAATKGDAEMQAAFPGMGRDVLRGWRANARAVHGIPVVAPLPAAGPPDPRTLIAQDWKAKQAAREQADLKTRYGTLLEDHARTQFELDALKKLGNVSPSAVVKRGNSKKSEAAALILASDWHAEEPVDPASVNGLNEYSTDIFRQRAENFFHNAAKLVKKERAATRIDTVVLWLGGDFYTGSIHEDTAETNSLPPVDAVRLVQGTLAGGIQYLLDELKPGRLVVPCNDGNHGRMTERMRVHGRKGNSLEHYMFFNLAAQCPGAEFLISDSIHTYVEVLGHTVCFTHGDSINYGGGVGGITIPVAKAIAAWDEARRADIYAMGHFHMYMAGRKSLHNGSLIGYGPYSLAIKAPYEPPRQMFALVDADEGRTVIAPIFVTHQR